MMGGVVVFGGTFSARSQDFSASAHRLPRINFCSSLQTQHIIEFTQSLFAEGYKMPGGETLRALRLLSRRSAGLLSGPEQVTV